MNPRFAHGLPQALCFLQVACLCAGLHKNMTFRFDLVALLACRDDQKHGFVGYRVIRQINCTGIPIPTIGAKQL